MDWRRCSVIGGVGLVAMACGRAPLTIEDELAGTTSVDTGEPTPPPPVMESGPDPAVDGTTGLPSPTTGSSLDEGASTGPVVDDSTTGVPPREDSSTGDVTSVSNTGTDDDATSTGTECNDVPGVYADCTNGASCESPLSECLATGDNSGTCTFSCETACDCPAAPPTGDAAVVCTDIVGPGGRLDGVSDCYLSCEAGESCPDGQQCFAGVLCAHTNSMEVEPYEACDGDELVCPADHQCILDDPSSPDFSSCLASNCMDVLDCPTAPVGGTLACGEIAGPGVDYCYLDCSGGTPCPDGWDCLLDLVCVQPIPA